MKTHIFRIEHSSKKRRPEDPVFAGPYGVSNVFSFSDWGDVNHPSENRPPPKDDLILNTFHLDNLFSKEIYFFGFASISDLEKWFSICELKNLKELGFVIARYESSNFIHGKTQSIFLPSSERTIIEILPSPYQPNPNL